MKCRLFTLISMMLLLTAIGSLAYGQGATSSLAGAVVDQRGDAIAGAQVTVKHAATGEEFAATTAGNGTFFVPTLAAGTYTVTIAAQGFKQAVVTDVKLDAGTPGSVRVSLEVGAASESVTVQGGAEILQTQSANIATTLNVNQIASLPLISRNPINFLVLTSGVTTPTDNRNSIVNGLPEAVIDITLDGINIQDNFNKTTDGLFARVAPSLDSVQEVTISTGTPDASGGALGGVSVKFVTRQGTNELHGSLYEYHRNPVLNSNYWFNNRDQAPYNVKTAKFCGDPSNSTFNAATMEAYNSDNCHAARPRVLFNQYGGRLGGPIWIPKLFDGRNKAFFFVNYEEFKQPTQVNRQRTILSPQAQIGNFQYNSSTGVRQVNLLTLAATNGQTATADPIIQKLLADIRSATNGVGGITQLTDPNFQRFSYSPSGSSFNQRPTVRFDVNMTEKHHFEAGWTYFRGRGGPDFLNNVEPAFPGFPNEGSQPADRYTGSVAVRSTLTPTLVNEARAGLSGGPSRFNPSASAATFSGPVANQGGFALNINGAIGNSLSNPYVVTAPSRRNPLFRTISDTATWTRGAHSLSFGGQYTEVKLTYNAQTLVPTIGFGVNTNDPANAMFVAANFQGASATDITNARNIYAVLTGRVTAINATARLTEDGKYEYLGNAFERSRQREIGFFAQDGWRIRPNLTLNYGLRWELQGAFTPNNSSYTTVTLDDLWGVSGPGNLFKPGTLTGRTTQFVQFKKGDPSYDADYKNFAPSFGFAWSPNFKSGLLKRLAGEGGQSVVRGGYSISYSRFGIGDFRGVLSANPGVILTTNRDLTIGNLVTNQGTDRLPVLLRETNRLGPPAFAATPTYPFIAGTAAAPITASANIYDPNLKVPYVQSWSFGIQREINKNTAVEVRYVGTRYLRGWTTYDLNDNENNILENGLLNEFKLAQANLQANIAAGRANQGYRYMGPGTGTVPLPITLAYFSGKVDPNVAANYSSTNFTSTTFTNQLALFNPAPNTYAANLHSDATRRANALAAGLPANFFLTNPDLRGGANFTGNGGYTRFDGLQIDLRRRLSKGLLVQSNYQFAKGFSSSRLSFRAPRVNALNTFNLKHSFKVNWVYELPIGRGKALFGNAGTLLDRLIGGWEFDGTGRVQSGQLFNFGNVRLVGMTMKDLQKAYKPRFDDAAKIAYILPQDIIDNTIRANNVSATSANGYGSLGAPTGRYIAPANSNPGCIQVYGGECAPQNVYVTGPKFTRFDLSVVKKVRITERMNFELRGEFLNAFNNINFFNPNTTATTTLSNSTFGQVTSAYTDSSNTNDPGGRIIQIVARFNF